MKWAKKIKILLILGAVLFVYSNITHSQEFWPPVVGNKFPDFELIDQEGKRVHVSDFKGKLIFIEYIGMNCPACQAFSGARKSGAFENNSIQQNLSSIEEYFPQYTGGLLLPSKGIVYLQIILYDMRLGFPKADDARKWAQHFGFQKSQGQYILVPINDLRGKASYNLIPGFQLIDQDLVVRSDSTGHHPQDNLYKTLLPMVPKLLK